MIRGYIRVSTSEQADSQLGIEGQRAAIAKYAGDHDFVLYEDAGVSGAKPPHKRPGLSELLSDLEKGDVLLVAKRDRLARDIGIMLVLESVATRSGATIASCAGEGSSDPNNPAEWLLAHIIDLFAEYERLIIGVRTSIALQAKKRRGEAIGPPRFGTKVVDGKVVDDRREMETLALVTNMRERGMGFQAIGDALFVMGHRNNRSKTGRFHPQTIKRMLS